MGSAFLTCPASISPPSGPYVTAILWIHNALNASVVNDSCI
jgi:hypothetical protein